MTLSDNNTHPLETLTATETVDQWHQENRDQAGLVESPTDEQTSELGEILSALRETDLTEPVGRDFVTETAGSRVLDWLLSPRVRQWVLLLTTLGALTLGAWLVIEPLIIDGRSGGSTGPVAVDGEDEPAISSEASSVSSSGSVTEGQTVEGRSADGLLVVTATRSEAQTNRGWWIAVEDDWSASDPAEVTVLVNGVVVQQMDQAPFEFWLDAESTQRDGRASGPIVVSAVVEWRNGSGQGSPATVVLTEP